VLNDENELTHELEQIAGMLRRRGRDAVVANAADLATDGEKVKCEGRMVSLTLNKMRISTPESPHHCWKPGFEARYTAFLQGQREGRFVSLNNLPAMTIAEDKSLLGVMLEPEVFDLYNAGEQAFLQSVVLKTARLDAGAGALPGEAVADQFPQHASVVKPGNEGRGFGVVLGPHVDRDTWQQATAFDPAVPKIVQEYAAPASMPLVSSRGGELRETSMYLSLGLAVSRGKFRGIMSRISESPVTNVAKDGTVQAVFCMDERLEHETLAPTR